MEGLFEGDKDRARRFGGIAPAGSAGRDDSEADRLQAEAMQYAGLVRLAAVLEHECARNLVGAAAEAAGPAGPDSWKAG